MRLEDRARQGEINKRLRPWLDFASLLPCKVRAPWPSSADPETIERVFKEGASPEPDDRNPGLLRFRKYPADQLFRHRCVTEERVVPTTDAKIAAPPGVI